MISSVGTINYHQTPHQLYVVSAAPRPTTGNNITFTMGSNSASNASELTTITSSELSNVNRGAQQTIYISQSNMNPTGTTIITTSSTEQKCNSSNNNDEDDDEDDSISNNKQSSTNQSISNATATAAATAAAAKQENTEKTTTNSCQPRLHPKKRKFNPAELEEMEPTSNMNNNISSNSIAANHSTLSTVNNSINDSVKQQATTTVTYVSISGNNSTIEPANTNKHLGMNLNDGCRTIRLNDDTSIPIVNNYPQVSLPVTHSTIKFVTADHDNNGSHKLFSQGNSTSDTISTEANVVLANQQRYNYSNFNSSSSSSNNIMDGSNNGNSYILMSGHSPRSQSQHEKQQQQQLEQKQQHKSNITTADSVKYNLNTPSTSTIVRHTVPVNMETSNETIDLNDWCNYRVLAKQGDIYVAGVIRSVDPNNEILVEFDHPEGTQQMYNEVLTTGRYDVISDASPSASDVSTKEKYDYFFSTFIIYQLSFSD